MKTAFTSLVLCLVVVLTAHALPICIICLGQTADLETRLTEQQATLEAQHESICIHGAEAIQLTEEMACILHAVAEDAKAARESDETP